LSNSYTYNPDAWNPYVAGAVAGAIAAFVAGLVSLVLRSPDEIVANSLSVVVGSLVLGVLAGGLWRKLRAGDNPQKVFAWSMVGGFLVLMLALTAADQFLLSSLIPYAAPLAVIIFITLAFFVPVLSRSTAPLWVAALSILLVLAMGVGLFGRGNVASGELALDDLSAEATAQSTQGAADRTDGLVGSYTVARGVATYTVPERLQGLSSQGVGATDAVTGQVTTGGEFTFELDLQSFESDQSRRDGKVREWFANDPVGTFTGTSFTVPPETAVGESVFFVIDGTMTVNGIDGGVTWDMEARREENGTVSVRGSTDIVLSDYNVPVFTSTFVTIEDSARIEVLVSLAPN